MLTKINQRFFIWTKNRVDENLDVNTLVSVTNRGKHFYTLETDFSKGARLKTYPANRDEPRLRPTVTGNLELGEIIGTFKLRGKEHPVYNKIVTYNKGGAVMKKQEGGLADDGGTIEEESGNEVPVGSLKSEVRDDIDAKLSEGEFVFPADVVRFIGLNKLMSLRQKAKQGLQQMEDMGQMGNAEEATMEDSGEWNEDAMIEPEVKMAPGGLVSTTSNQSSRFAGLAPTLAPVEQQPMQEEDEEILDEFANVYYDSKTKH